MDFVLEDIKKTVENLESTILRADNIFEMEQRKVYKRLIKYNSSSPSKGSTPGFLQAIGNILQGKKSSEAKRLRQETQKGEDSHIEHELEKGFSLIDTLPFQDLKDYYYATLEHGLSEANLMWAKRDKVFAYAFKDSNLKAK